MSVFLHSNGKLKPLFVPIFANSAIFFAYSSFFKSFSLSLINILLYVLLLGTIWLERKCCHWVSGVQIRMVSIFLKVHLGVVKIHFKNTKKIEITFILYFYEVCQNTTGEVFPSIPIQWNQKNIDVWFLHMSVFWCKNVIVVMLHFLRFPLSFYVCFRFTQIKMNVARIHTNHKNNWNARQCNGDYCFDWKKKFSHRFSIEVEKLFLWLTKHKVLRK